MAVVNSIILVETYYINVVIAYIPVSRSFRPCIEILLPDKIVDSVLVGHGVVEVFPKLLVNLSALFSPPEPCSAVGTIALSLVPRSEKNRNACFLKLKKLFCYILHAQLEILKLNSPLNHNICSYKVGLFGVCCL